MVTTTENAHLDENVEFTQTSATTWGVTTAEGVIVGHVEKDGDVFAAFDATGERVSEHPTAQSGMFALVTGTPAP